MRCSFAITATLLLLFLTATPSAAPEIDIQGIAPYGITASSLSFEYNRIFYTLSARYDNSRAPVRIIFYTANDNRYNHALPEWGGGGAIGRDTIIIPLDAKPFLQLNPYQVAVHELTHIALNRLVPSALPRWFHEGVAMTLCGEFSMQEQLTVSRAIVTGNLLTLRSIDSVNTFTQGRADLAYSQSHLAILYIIEKFGMPTVGMIIARTALTSSFESALYDITGMQTHEFERAYRSSLNERYRFLFLVADWNIAWIAIALLAIVAAIVARMRYNSTKNSDNTDPMATGMSLSTSTESTPFEDSLPDEIDLEDDDDDDERTNPGKPIDRKTDHHNNRHT